MLKFLKHRLKEVCLGIESRPIRLVLDQYLKRRAGHRVGLSDPGRIHEAIRVPLQTELGRILEFSSEFEIELYVRRFEVDFARRCNRRFAVGTHSGTAALQLSLVALNIGPGDEVITVPNTYIATALAISNTGATPVFVDVEDGTFNMDPRRIEAAITARTRAIVPVYLYGQMADMPEITRIAAAHGLKVIEDACQAFGAELDGRKAGQWGDVGCFSFSTPKNLSGFGNGGIVVSDDRELMERIRFHRNPESNGAPLKLGKRTPCYLDAVQVAFIRAKLPSVESWMEKRRDHAAHYRRTLVDVAEVRLPEETRGSLHSYYRFVLRTSRRRSLKLWLEKRGIRCGTPYSPSLHLTQTYSDLGYSAGSFPVVEAAERDSVFLPVSAFLAVEERERVSRTVMDFFSM